MSHPDYNHCHFEILKLYEMAVTFEKSMDGPQKLEIELPFNLVIALLRRYTQHTKTLIRRDTYTSMFIGALFTTAKLGKQPMSTDR